MFTFFSLNPLFPHLLLLVLTGLLKPMRNLILQTYFADVSVETLGGVADCPFLCQYYSRNTDCLQPMAPHSQTTILDKRLSIHCNSSCLYNRCGSTDVYVLYSRVHFYYLQIKDCVEEGHGFFFFVCKLSGVKSLWSWTWSWALLTTVNLTMIMDDCCPYTQEDKTIQGKPVSD